MNTRRFRPSFRPGVVLLALLLGPTIPAPLLGQEDTPPQSEAQRATREFQNRRALNGHTFMPSRHVGQPFIAGWLRGLLAGAFASGLQVPALDPLGGPQGVTEGDLATLLVDAEYQQRFGTWVTARVGFTGAARVGVNRAAALAQGAQGQFGFNFGTTVKILQSKQVALSAVGDARFNQAYALNLARFIRDLITDGLGGARLLDKGWVNTYTAGLRIAWSPSKWFGFAALAEGGLGTPFLERQGNSAVVGLGLSAEYDLGAGTKVPLGFQAFLRWDNFVDLFPELSDDIWRTGLVIGYTGVENFYAGFEIGVSGLGLRDDLPAVIERSGLDVISLGLVMRHYF